MRSPSSTAWDCNFRVIASDRNKGIAETMAEKMPSKDYIANCRWMTESDLQVYATQFTRTGFQGGLNYYRADSDVGYKPKQTIDVPACFIGGGNEWAVYQSPGVFENMHNVCEQLVGIHLIPKTGHSIAEENPRERSIDCC